MYAAQSSQKELYKKEIHPLLQTLTDGFDCTVFCYGMTGSGKTYTMQGPPQDPGIIPRTIASLVKLVEDSRYKINASFFEVYNEKIFDSLKGDYDTSLLVRQDSKGNINILNLSEVFP